MAEGTGSFAQTVAAQITASLAAFKTYRPLLVQTGDLGTLADLNERVLKSVAIPANTLNVNTRRLWGRAWGVFAANANAKTLRTRLGPVTLVGTIIGSGPTAAPNGETWEIEFEIIRTGVATQVTMVTTTFHAPPGGYMTTESRVAGAVDETLAQLLEITGLNGVATANDIVASGLVVGIIDGP